MSSRAARRSRLVRRSTEAPPASRDLRAARAPLSALAAATLFALATLACDDRIPAVSPRDPATSSAPSPATTPLPPSAPPHAADGAVAEQRITAVVAELASPPYEGRGIGTKGLALAEDFVAARFRALNLAPYFSGGFKQAVALVTGIVVDYEHTVLYTSGKPLSLPSLFVPTPFSASAAFEGFVADGGHCVVAPEEKVDELAGAGVKGKVVLCRRGLPKALEKKAKTANPRRLLAHGNLRHKAWSARERGAKAILFWDDKGPDPAKKKTFSASGPTSDVGIPVGFVRRSVAEELRAPKKDARAWVRGEAALTRRSETAYNLVATLGAGCARGVRPVIVGAHVDHLGFGNDGSFEGSRVIHPGADDNASGVAGVLEIARALAAAPAPKACFVFAIFTGEESGLAGSSMFANGLKDAKKLPKAMLNLDMVGRLRGEKLMVFGTDSSQRWRALVDAACAVEKLACPGGGDGYGPSDHMPFYLAGVPVLHFFTGAHDDYHRKSDTAEKLSVAGLARIARIAASLAKAVMDAKESLAFRAAAKERDPHSGLARVGSLHGAYLGTIPDYSEMSAGGGIDAKKVRGVRLAGVRAGAPADKAGLRTGDVLVRIDGRAVHSLEDMTLVLATLRPGRSVVLEILRDGVVRKKKAVVGRRP